MENIYQTYFAAAAAAACSSSATSSPASSDIMNGGHQFELLPASNSKPSSSSPSGFLGLLSDMEVNNNNNPAPPAADHRNSSSSSNSNGLSLGNITKNKKGEKKVKKPRHAFQTRSQVDILDDGYRWRKYGQKAVKNNKFPRSYYRCTHQGCNVKKQVQRLTKDEGVVVTTYEGMHSHPIEKSTDNFEHILSQMQIFTSY